MDRSAFSKEFERINRRFEKSFFPKIKRAIHIPVEGAIKALKRGGYNEAMTFVTTINGNEALYNAVKDLYITVGLRHARMNYSRLMKERDQKFYSFRMELKRFSYNEVWMQLILDYLSNFLTEKITWTVTETLRNRLLKAISDGMEAGDGVDKMVEAIQNWPFEEYQAARIVRTETNRAANAGARAQATTDEYQQIKEWISAEDNRVRGLPEDHADHRELDGTRIDEYESFRDSRNGDLLDVPGDPRASAASVINCRCAVAYTYKRDVNGNLIKKRKSTVVIFPAQVRRPQAVLV